MNSRFGVGLVAGGVLSLGGFFALVLWALSDGWSGEPTAELPEAD